MGPARNLKQSVLSNAEFKYTGFGLLKSFILNAGLCLAVCSWIRSSVSQNGDEEDNVLALQAVGGLICGEHGPGP